MQDLTPTLSLTELSYRGGIGPLGADRRVGPLLFRPLVLGTVIAVSLTVGNSLAQEVTLAWNPSLSPNVGGYELYYGLSSGQYTTVLDVGNQTRYTVSDLEDGVIYYFAVTAYDTTGTIESAFSNEVDTGAMFGFEGVVSGNVRLADGTPLCAMVLANGQFMFTCDGTGAYRLEVPLDTNGEVTLFAFADGFAPFRLTATPNSLPTVVVMQTAPPASPLVSMSRAAECAGDWVRVSGDVESYGSEPLCAMVLANGQHMFSCGSSLGRYNLTVPIDQDGYVTIFAFADGFQPYSDIFLAPRCEAGAFDG